MKKVSYLGIREADIVRVLRLRPGYDSAQGTPLPLRLDLRRHSPSGPDWGYPGSGPAQLSLAVLADFLDDDEAALALYQDFKFSVIAALPRARWILTERDLTTTLTALCRTQSDATICIP